MGNTQRIESVERAAMRALCKSVLPPEFQPPASDFEIANWEVDPSGFSDAETFKRVYLCSSFLRKWKGLKSGIDLEGTALRSWHKSELGCFATNRRLELEASTGTYSVAPSLIQSAQRKISQVLGRVNYDTISALARFGNGATRDLRRGSTHAEKMQKPSVTISAIPIACRLLSGDEYMGKLVGGFRDLTIVEGNRMVMVPKSAKTHRPIAAEPTLNSFCQQGVGRYIRMRLKHFGVNLDDQTINQGYAFAALADGLSTIDLSSASDSLCTNLVKLLLPWEWYELLASLRSPKTNYKGRDYVLSKFSSMGNAYTFELESLIFWALCSSVVGDRGVTSVYGDDIVVPNTCYSEVVEILTWSGFSVNYDKSFFGDSRFYESCGSHFFDLEEVTPCYQKDVCTRPVDFVRLHNRLARAGIRLGLYDEIRPVLALVRRLCRASFPRRTPDVGPVVEYDEYFIDRDFRWSSPLVDRVRLRSLSTITRINLRVEAVENFAYLGRKLRSPEFLNPSPDGQCSESSSHTLTVFGWKRHWRSST